jgi:hypothetical protein
MRRRPWGDVQQPTRRHLRAILRDLGSVYDLRGLLAWRLAQQVAELWLVTRGVSVEAATTSEQRRRGRGRRATRRVVNAVAKRQGQHMESLTKALAQLEALAGPRPGADQLDQVLAELRSERRAGRA